MLDFDLIESKLEMLIEEMYDSKLDKKRNLLEKSFRNYVDLMDKKGTGYKTYYEKLIPFFYDIWYSYNKERKHIGDKFIKLHIDMYKIK